MKIKLSKRERLLVLILAAAVLIYLYMSYLLFPSYTRVSKLNTELILKQQIAKDTKDEQMRLENMDSILAKSKARLDEMEKKIPYNIRLPELIVNIDSSIAGFGMNMKSISVGKPDTANKDYDIITITVSLEGKYDNILAFIDYIENNDRKFIIDNFLLAPESRTKAIPFDITMRTFVLKGSKEAAIPEPEDYKFFRHENGKSYPFLINGKKVNVTEKGIDADIEKMVNKLDSLKLILPNNNKTGKGN